MEVVLQRFVGDAWRPFEDEVRFGRLSHAECLRLQVSLVQAPAAEFLGALAAEARTVPGLAGFVHELARRRGEAAIVSAGFREAIESVWRREALPPVEVFASELVSHDGGESGALAIAFNAALGDCPRCGPGSCKAAVLRALRRPGDLVLAFGDGAADLCMARAADLTFARGYLAQRCREEGLEWRPLRDFTGVWDEVDAWLAGRIS